ncbi:caspase domain-containing protein [Streptomyces sp. NPDC053086]|uniref:caspase family protein n=1 Tax=unclassified Streptomyces TaxID=2593676 RepID=UPI0037CDF488
MLNVDLSDPMKSMAVFVGDYDYAFTHDSGDLPGLARSVRRMKELFADPKVWGLPPERCFLPKTRDAVFDSIHKAVASATDTLLFYYAGHGHLSPDTEELHLALPSSDPDRLDTWLRFDELGTALLTRDGTYTPSRARRRVVILDCCHSGLGLRRVPDTTYASRFLGVEGTYLLTSTSGSDKSWCPPDGPYSAFSGELIRLLENGIPGAPGLLTMDSIFRALRKSLLDRDDPWPQRPQQLNIATAGQISIARNLAPDEPGPAAPQERDAQTWSDRYDPILMSWWDGVIDTVPPQPGRVGRWKARHRDQGGLLANNLGPRMYAPANMRATFSRRGLSATTVVSRHLTLPRPDVDELATRFAEYAELTSDVAAIYLWRRPPSPWEMRNRVLLVHRCALRYPAALAGALRRAYAAAPLRTHDLCDAAEVPTPPLTLTYALHRRVHGLP